MSELKIKSTPKIIICTRCKKEREQQGGKGLCKYCYKYLWTLNKYKNAPLIKCICHPNCDVMIRAWDTSGRPRKYTNGHNGVNNSGKNNGKFKSWIRPRGNGYFGILFKDHPYADISGYMAFHRIVYEMFHKCCLLPWSDVHHIDGNKKRNHPENLQGMLHSEHSIITNIERKKK